MKFALFGTAADCAELSQWLCEETEIEDIATFDNTENLLPALTTRVFDAVIVLCDGGAWRGQSPPAVWGPAMRRPCWLR